MINKTTSAMKNGIIDGLTLAIAAFVLYQIYQNAELVLTIACALAPVIILLGIVDMFYRRRWQRLSR